MPAFVEILGITGSQLTPAQLAQQSPTPAVHTVFVPAVGVRGCPVKPPSSPLACPWQFACAIIRDELFRVMLAKLMTERLSTVPLVVGKAMACIT